MIALDLISSGPVAPRAVPISELTDSHGTTAGASRMYQRFFGQHSVLMHEADHADMIRKVLQETIEHCPELRETAGILVYTKTQSHNTLPEQDWLRSILDALGLKNWEALTLSMTNCASALVAVHAFHEDGRPLIVVSGEKAFHRFGNRLAVGLLGEAPIAALFSNTGSRPVLGTNVRHLPRYHLNPDDMVQEDRSDLQQEFEAEFELFITECMTRYPDFFARKPVIIPYNLNVPLVLRLLERRGLSDQLIEGYSGTHGHTFCSDTLLNFKTFPVPLPSPVFLFCAGMGVTYAAVLLDAAQPCFPPTSN